MATNIKPNHVLRCSNIRATIWQNASEKGPFFATTFSRPFKDQSGAWRNATYFGLNDLEALITITHEQRLGWPLMSCGADRFNGKPSVVRRLPNPSNW
jgi:hypothetical protein